MSTAALISVEDYLRTTYEPDCDYVDGEVIERNVGERHHSDWQSELVHYFRAHVWVINPENRRVWVYTADGSREVKDDVLRTDNPSLLVNLSEIFSGIDS